MAAFTKADLEAAAAAGAEAAIRKVLSDGKLLNPKWKAADPNSYQSILTALTGLVLRTNANWVRVSGISSAVAAMPTRITQAVSRATAGLKR